MGRAGDVSHGITVGTSSTTSRRPQRRGGGGGDVSHSITVGTSSTSRRPGEWGGEVVSHTVSLWARLPQVDGQVSGEGR